MDNNKNTQEIKKLQQEIIDLKKSLMNLNFQKSSGQLENTSKIKTTKKNIAKIKSKISILNIGDNNA